MGGINIPMAGGIFGTGTMTGGSISQTLPSQTSLKKPAKVRNVFPETWLWNNETIGYNSLNDSI